jgi:hypothetical protein
MPRPFGLLLLLCGALFAAPAVAAPAHEHGVATLNVSLEGHALEIALDSPLDNLLGFEHAPITEVQRTLVVAMARRLRDAGAVLQPNSAARCTPVEVHMASSALPPAMLGEAEGQVGVAHEPPGHADLAADFHFDCVHPEALRELRVGFFEAFSGFRLIRVQAVGPHGQTYAELTASVPVFEWKAAHD